MKPDAKKMTYILYGVCGSRISRQFVHRVAVLTGNSDQQCWSLFSIGVYGSKLVFPLPFVKYCSNQQTVSQKKFSFGPSLPVMTFIFCSEVRITQGGGKPPFPHRRQCYLGPAFRIFTAVARCTNRREIRDVHTPYNFRHTHLRIVETKAILN